MLKIILRCLVFIFCLPLVACSTPPANGSFEAGKDYQVIPSALGVTTPANSKIAVIEFFSYGCPWCYHLEPDLETWIAHKPKNVTFERIPVVFEQGWDVLAKIYYTAKDLGVAESLMLPTFAAIQDKGQNLTDPTLMLQFFVAHGVKQQDFESAYSFSPGIDAQMMRGDKLMRQYGIFAVPSFVINGKYMTNMGMAHGDNKRLLQTINYLINKESQPEKH